jgi:hypothetical protein
MLKKIVFAAALVVGFVTSFNVTVRGNQRTVDVVRGAEACGFDCGKTCHPLMGCS